MLGKRQFSAVAAALAIVSVSVLAFGALAIDTSASAAPAPAAADAPLAPVMLIVDTDKVLSESKAMKGLQGQAETQQQALQKEFTKKQEDLRSAEAELRKEQGSVPADAFQDKVHAFEKRVGEVQREAASKKQSLEQGFGESLGKVKRALVEVVRDIASERHANMVLQAAPFMIFDPSYDASAEALRRLDQKLPSVQLVLAKVPPPGAAPDVADGSAPAAPAPAPSKKK
jgi:Skp family chaperone for outer membrane proteins